MKRKANLKHNLTAIILSLLLTPLLLATEAQQNFTPVEPNVALEKLKSGNKRYIELKQTRDGLAEEDRLRIVSEQHPHTIVLACSDSRVPPEIVFDQRLGDLFVVRTAGEALDKIALGSIEYALEHLKSRLLVVLGHESCGAVNAVLNTPKEQSAGSKNLDALISNLRPNLEGVTRSRTLLSESTANAKAVAKQLSNPEVSEIIAKHLNSGALVIKSGIYHLGTGIVEFHE